MQTPPALVPPPIPTTNPPPKTTDSAKVWASVVAMLGCFGISTLALIFIPRDTWDWLGAKVGHLFTIIVADPVSASAAVVSVMTFVAGIVAGGRALLHMAPPAPAEAPRPQRISRTSGSAHIHVLGWLTIGFVALLAGCSLLAGCGASALSTQARAATIVGVGLSSVGQELHDERAQALDACHDTDCESTTTSAWAPAVAAYESARTALTTWIDALDVARQAGEPDGDILGALFVAVSRLAREWNALAAALRGVGVDMPDLPPALAVLLGAAGASS